MKLYYKVKQNLTTQKKVLLKNRTSPNSGLAQLGFEANFKVGLVLENWFLNQYIWLTKSPTAPSHGTLANSLGKLQTERTLINLNKKRNGIKRFNNEVS